MRETLETKREVKLFVDSDITGEQSVFLERPENGEFWAVITHNGNEISLSVENFKNMISLFNDSLINFE